MKRVLVIGPSGAGKSTFARALRDRTGLPLYYLDMIWHRPDRTHITREEFDEKLAALLDRDEWIIDGDYSRTLEARLMRADTVFFLDYPVDVCLTGVESRRGMVREDMPWVETEEDPEFTAWIRDFPEKQIPRTYGILGKYSDTLEIHVFHSRGDADKWLKGDMT